MATCCKAICPGSPATIEAHFLRWDLACMVLGGLVALQSGSNYLMYAMVPRGASAATAYHKLLRGAAHMVPSYPAPPAECKAGSGGKPSPFLSSEKTPHR